MTLYRLNEKLMLRSVYSDGSSGKREMVSKEQGKDLLLEEKLGNDFGEYFVVNSSGNLEFWSENGNYYTASKFQ